MTDRHDPDDILALVARYAPTTATLSADWDTVRPDGAVERIVAEDPANTPVRLVPRAPVAHRRRAGRVPVLASAAVFAVAATVLAAVLVNGMGSNDDRSIAPGGAPHGPTLDPPAGLSTKALTAKQYSYHVLDQIDVDKSGRAIKNSQNAMVDRSYVAANGDIISFRTGSQHGCLRFKNHPDIGYSQPSVALLATLPTDVTELERYLRTHAHGSSSRDEAVFVTVGDALRTADALASPRLRAAMVAVLSRTPGVFVHENQRDYLGRPAIRLDFVNQKIRAGEVHSYYFDPTDYRMLEERDGHNSRPTAQAGPTPAYNAPAPTNADDPETLTGAAYVGVVRSEKVVTKLPKIPHDCGH